MDRKIKRLFRRGIMIALTVFFIGILIPTAIFGADGSIQQAVSTLEEGQTLDGPGFFTGTTVRVDGNVEGTTFVTGQDVTITGNINGDLIVAAQKATITGTVSGNIYCAGQYVTVQGRADGDTFLAAQDITIGNASEFGRDLFTGGTRVAMDGSVQRDFHGGGSDIVINGPIGRNADLDGTAITIGSSAVIGGDLTYQSEEKASIASESKINGTTDWKYIDRTSEKKMMGPQAMMGGKVLHEVIGFAGMLLVWFLIRIWRPEIWIKTSDAVFDQPVKTLGIGAITLIVTPILSILLMITVIGIPAGVLLGIAYAVSLYLSKIIAAVFLGSWIAKRFGWRERHKGVWNFLLGLVILTLLSMIPIVMMLVWLAVVFMGLGSIVSVNLRTAKKAEEPPAQN